MAGEIMAGMVQGTTQAVAEVTAMPVVSAGATLAPAAVMSAAVVAETTQRIGESLEAVKSSVLPKVSVSESSAVKLGDQLHSMVEQTSDGHTAMMQLAFGDTGGRLLDGAPEVSDPVVQQDFLALEHMGPRQAGEVVQQAEGLQLPKDMVNDPQFLALFAEELGQDMAAQKSLLKEGKLSEDEYLAMRQSMLQHSAEKAAGRREDSSVSENDLEELKRKAALEAIRQHMMLWRYSVMKDKRLTPEAKQLALRRVDRLEQRLLVQEAIRWDGLSIMKMIVLASAWMQEMADQ